MSLPPPLIREGDKGDRVTNNLFPLIRGRGKGELAINPIRE